MRMTPREELLEMLTYRRPAGSKHERKFINRFIRPLGVTEDGFGNLFKQVGEGSAVLWSSHTDTVHRTSGRQRVEVIKGIAKAVSSDCLGADCTTGVWLMMHMIRAGVPGLYVFHRSEEVGGLGSDYFAKNGSVRLAGIKYAIAFDRYGQGSVITHQWGGRCCSDEFARSLSKEIGMSMRLDDGGTFTDTANYTHLIGECTNVSVGYQRQHHYDETQDLNFADELLTQMVMFEESRLVSKRMPGEVDDDFGVWRRAYGSYSTNYDTDYKSALADNDHLDGPGYHLSDGSYVPYQGGYTNRDNDQWNMTQAVMDNPEAAAEMLLGFGISPDELLGSYVPRSNRRRRLG